MIFRYQQFRFHAICDENSASFAAGNGVEYHANFRRK
jgi:hypothetical protein